MSGQFENSGKEKKDNGWIIKILFDSGLYKYDRILRNRKNYFEISVFLLIERGISRMEKLKVILHFATTEMCLFVFLYLFLLL